MLLCLCAITYFIALNGQEHWYRIKAMHSFFKVGIFIMSYLQKSKNWWLQILTADQADMLLGLSAIIYFISIKSVLFLTTTP